jgi:hypothetical protein
MSVDVWVCAYECGCVSVCVSVGVSVCVWVWECGCWVRVRACKSMCECECGCGCVSVGVSVFVWVWVCESGCVSVGVWVWVWVCECGSCALLLWESFRDNSFYIHGISLSNLLQWIYVKPVRSGRSTVPIPVKIRFFLFSKRFGMVIGPTQPSIQTVQVFLCIIS